MADASKIDRQTTAPFLLRLFYKKGAFHRPEDFTAPRLPQHLQIYTWQSCTLSELTHLLLSALPSLLPGQYAGSRIAFRLFYADMQGPQRPGMQPRFIARDLGSVIVGAASVDANGRPAGDETQEEEDEAGNEQADGESVKEALKQLSGELTRTLEDARFVIGDYISAVILPPLPDGSVAPPPPAPFGPQGRGPAPRDTYGGRPGPRENGFGGRGGDYDRSGGGRGGRGGRFEDRQGSGRDFPAGEWRRGEAPPAPERDSYWRGGGGGRGRSRGRW